jgi:hypothetical protein
MKVLIRVVVVCGIAIILSGVWVANRAIVGLDLVHGATISMYQYNKPTIVKAYCDVNVWDNLDMFYALRIDTVGDDKSARDVVMQLRAEVVDTQVLAKTTVLYGYSPMLPLRQISNGQLVNLMIAIVDGKMSIGYPILMGSY